MNIQLAKMFLLVVQLNQKGHDLMIKMTKGYITVLDENCNSILLEDMHSINLKGKKALQELIINNKMLERKLEG